MAWTDRLKEAAYVAPSGTRQVFHYEDVSNTIERKTTAYEFPDAEGTFVQEHGSAGRRFPLKIFFFGDDCDLHADSFSALLAERGVGTLESPVYKNAKVVPFGVVRRQDPLASAGNQVIFDVEFVETIDLIYPTSQSDPASSVLDSVASFNKSSAQQFADQINITSALEKSDLLNNYQSLLKRAKEGLRAVADSKDDVSRAFNTIYDSINDGISTFIGEPLDLANQTAILLQAPARAADNIAARLSAYNDLSNSIVNSDDSVVESAGYDNRVANEFHTEEFFATQAVAGSIVSSVNTQFVTRDDAILAALVIQQQFDTVTAWRDANYEILSATTPRNTNTVASVDTGESYQQLQKAVALTSSYLVYISFSLKQERRIILDRDRTLIDLCAELHGSIDDQIDFMIASNKLTGSEILELPRGKEIRYYV